MKIALGLIALFVTLPIWFYLMYQILVKVEATELMWFLYWVYLPLTLLLATVREFVGDEKKVR